MIIYLAGPITGHEDTYRQAFAEVEDELTAQGHVVLNPARLPRGLDYESYMRIDEAMIRECDAVCMFPGWTESNGARREFKYARRLDKCFMIDGDCEALNTRAHRRCGSCVHWIHITHDLGACMYEVDVANESPLPISAPDRSRYHLCHRGDDFEAAVEDMEQHHLGRHADQVIIEELQTE